MTTLPAATRSLRHRETEAEPRQYLTFTLANETFAVAIGKVKEIVEFHSLTEIPLMPHFLRGVTNLRGAVIPVIDLLSRFGKGTTVAGARTCIVILEVEYDDARHPLGVMVNAVNEVLPVEESRIENRPAFGTHIRPDFVEALLNLGDRFVIALDVQQALSVDEMASLASQWSGGAAEGPTPAA